MFITGKKKGYVIFLLLRKREDDTLVTRLGSIVHRSTSVNHNCELLQLLWIHHPIFLIHGFKQKKKLQAGSVNLFSFIHFSVI